MEICHFVLLSKLHVRLNSQGLLVFWQHQRIWFMLVITVPFCKSVLKFDYDINKIYNMLHLIIELVILHLTTVHGSVDANAASQALPTNNFFYHL